MIGRRIGNYEIVEELGRGGMGVVFRARDLRLDRFVAIKFLPRDHEVSRESQQRFEREARAASALDHPNICTIHEIGETDDGELYIVMAYYEGLTLEHLLRSGPLAAGRIERFARQLASALACAHEAGIAHRDLKPANLVVTARDELKLLDFGLAKLGGWTRLTRDGTTLGTIDYMSPEQADGKESDERSDIWSFGVLLYRLSSGRLPFTGDSPAARIAAILNQEPAPLPPDTRPTIRQVVEACLEKAPAKRPQARDLLATLDPAGDTTVIAPTRAAPGPSWIRRVAMVVGLVAVVATGIAFLRGSGDEAFDRPAGDRDERSVAILPFAERGNQPIEDLGNGMVDLLSMAISGADGLRAVEASTVIRMAGDSGRSLEASQQLQLARRLGVTYYVTGEILALGPRVRVTARLWQSDQEPATDPVTQVVREAEQGDVFSLVDDLVAGLIVGQGSAATPASLDIAGASLEATKAFLEGEGALRAGDYREAANAFGRAVDADSTFALAHYRKSVSGEWIDAPDMRSSTDRAYALAARLPQPERDLVEALHFRRRGYFREAEVIYRQILHRYPDNAEAHWQIGEILFHESPRTGGSILEAAPHFQRVLDVEPDHLPALVHLARLHSLEGNLAELTAIADQVREVSPDSARGMEIEGLWAFRTGNVEAQDRVLEKLRDKPWYYVWYVAHGVSRFARDPFSAERILRAPPTLEPPLLATITNSLTIQGRLDELRQSIEGHREFSDPTFDLWATFLMTSGNVPTQREELEDLKARLSLTTPEALLASNWIPPYEDLTPQFMAFQRDWFLALLNLQLGNVEATQAWVDEHAVAPEFVGLGSLASDALKSIRAELLLESGDERGALEVLRTIEYSVPHQATITPITDLARSRFLRAELELSAGDPKVARGIYLGFDHSWGFVDTSYRPLAYRRLGEIAEAEGDLEMAAVWYDRLLDLWQDCDQELVPLREEIRGRREALGQGS